MDINDATPEHLEQVAQIDGERARYLVDYRRTSGPFESWDEVKRVPSYEDGMVERLQGAGYTIGGRAAREPGPSSGREASSRESSQSAAAGGHERAQTGEPRGSAERHGRRSLNRASTADLEQTHMIDGERAHRIVDYRQQHGRFTDWDQVKDVSGIDDGIVERLKESGFGVD